MENTTVDISFITINYNSSHYTIGLIESILLQTPETLSYEIIVVDNASEQKEYEALREKIAPLNQVRLVRNRINNGFAGGNMAGVNHARGTYYFFINNDCTLLNNAGGIMKGFMETHPRVAALGGKIVDEKGGFSSSYKQFPSVIKQWFGNGAHRRLSKNSFPSNKVRLNTPTPVEVISGSCMFFRADDFCSIGGFDTVFFLYCEEEDICKRVWDNGKEIYFLPEAEVFHEGGGSSERNAPLEKEFYISYRLLIEKHFGFAGRIAMKTALLLKQFRRIFTKTNGLSLFLFIASGSPIHTSLRYRQSVKP